MSRATKIPYLLITIDFLYGVLIIFDGLPFALFSGGWLVGLMCILSALFFLAGWSLYTLSPHNWRFAVILQYLIVILLSMVTYFGLKNLDGSDFNGIAFVVILAMFVPVAIASFFSLRHLNEYGRVNIAKYLVRDRLGLSVKVPMLISGGLILCLLYPSLLIFGILPRPKEIYPSVLISRTGKKIVRNPITSEASSSRTQGARRHDTKIRQKAMPKGTAVDEATLIKSKIGDGEYAISMESISSLHEETSSGAISVSGRVKTLHMNDDALHLEGRSLVVTFYIGRPGNSLKNSASWVEPTLGERCLGIIKALFVNHDGLFIAGHGLGRMQRRGESFSLFFDLRELKNCSVVSDGDDRK